MQILHEPGSLYNCFSQHQKTLIHCLLNLLERRRNCLLYQLFSFIFYFGFNFIVSLLCSIFHFIDFSHSYRSFIDFVSKLNLLRWYLNKLRVGFLWWEILRYNVCFSTLYDGSIECSFATLTQNIIVICLMGVLLRVSFAWQVQKLQCCAKWGVYGKGFGAVLWEVLPEIFWRQVCLLQSLHQRQSAAGWRQSSLPSYLCQVHKVRWSLWGWGRDVLAGQCDLASTLWSRTWSWCWNSAKWHKWPFHRYGMWSYEHKCNEWIAGM